MVVEEMQMAFVHFHRRLLDISWVKASDRMLHTTQTTLRENLLKSYSLINITAARVKVVWHNYRWPSVSYRRCEGLELIANGDHVSADCPQFQARSEDRSFGSVRHRP